MRETSVIEMPSLEKYWKNEGLYYEYPEGGDVDVFRIVVLDTSECRSEEQVVSDAVGIFNALFFDEIREHVGIDEIKDKRKDVTKKEFDNHALNYGPITMFNQITGLDASAQYLLLAPAVRDSFGDNSFHVYLILDSKSKRAFLISFWFYHDFGLPSHDEYFGSLLYELKSFSDAESEMLTEAKFMVTQIRKLAKQEDVRKKATYFVYNGFKSWRKEIPVVINLASKVGLDTDNLEFSYRYTCLHEKQVEYKKKVLKVLQLDFRSVTPHRITAVGKYKKWIQITVKDGKINDISISNGSRSRPHNDPYWFEELPESLLEKYDAGLRRQIPIVLNRTISDKYTGSEEEFQSIPEVKC